MTLQIINVKSQQMSSDWRVEGTCHGWDGRSMGRQVW